MATDNVTAIRRPPAEPPQAPDELQVRPEYFECLAGQPRIDDIIFGLAGVCSALDAVPIGHHMAFEEANRVANLARGANCLAAQLVGRLTHKPKRLRRARGAA